MKVGIRTISTRSINDTCLYYGKEAIGEYEGKPVFHSLNPKDIIPFDTENVSDLKRLMAKIKKFTTSGFNKEVTPVWIFNDGTIKREVTLLELNRICKRNLPNEYK